MTGRIRHALVAAAAVGMLAMPATAHAQFNFPAGGGTVLGFGEAYATGPDIFVQYLGFEAAYTDDLYFAISYGDTETFIFSNQVAAIGDVFSINDMVGVSAFTPYERVVFAMYVDACAGCTDSWAADDNRVYYTGDPTRNPDGLHHAKWATYSGTGMYDGMEISFDRQIGFEDILNGGDEDFDDLVFATYGVEVVPEPMSLLLLATGLAGVAGVAARRRKDSDLESDEV